MVKCSIIVQKETQKQKEELTHLTLKRNLHKLSFIRNYCLTRIDKKENVFA